MRSRQLEDSYSDWLRYSFSSTCSRACEEAQFPAPTLGRRGPWNGHSVPPHRLTTSTRYLPLPRMERTILGTVRDTPTGQAIRTVRKSEMALPILTLKDKAPGPSWSHSPRSSSSSELPSGSQATQVFQSHSSLSGLSP